MSGEGEGSITANARADLRDALQAATVGQFEIQDELGAGGMATVFLAHEIALDRPVAIKVMLPALLMTDGMVERFQREARTAASLSHPHIIPIYSVGDQAHLFYFVMKYVAGRALDQIIRDFGPMDFDTIEAILGQVGGAVAHAHRRGVIHRDIKPANIMIDEDGWAVVTDFGIAKTVQASGLTSAGASVGTPYYMSPEQYSGIAVTILSDQYSLGVVAYEMLAGKLPFAGRSFAELVRVHAFDGLPPITKYRPDCPAGLTRVVTKMLAKAPEDRFQTIDQALAELRPRQITGEDPVRTHMVSLARSGKRVVVPRPPTSPIPKNRISRSAKTIPSPAVQPARSPHPVRRGFLIALGLAFVAAGGAALSLLWTRSDRGRPSIVADSVQRSPQPPTAPPSGDSALPADQTTQTVTQRVAANPPPAPVPVRQPARASPTNGSKTVEVPSADTGAAPPSPPPPPPAATNGWIRLGTRTEGAVVYINGVPQLPKTPSLRWWKVPVGAVKIGVDADGCVGWEQTIQVVPGDSITIGYRFPRCGADPDAGTRDSTGG